MTTDPVELSRDLIRCASVTPADDGAIPMLETLLSEAGFTCIRADRGGIANLIARWGAKGAEKTFGFNGHTDVVPAGAIEDWTHGPFAAVVKNGVLWGRGATDMKTGVAAFVAAAVNLVETAPPDGAILITVTGDEEGPGVDGTRAILDRMAEDGERMSVCLVGEPTCPHTLGEMMKIGRRGSMTAYIEAEGVQGHSAYPHLAKNPVSALARLADRIASHKLDSGTEHFDSSTIALTGFDTGNAANNVIPATSRAMINIRFNDAHTSASISDWIREEAQAVFEETGVGFEIDIQVSGESFLTPPGPFSDMVADAVEAETGIRPEMSTSGGTSDARFIKDHCPVVEFGLVGQTMHQVDERIEVAQVTALSAIYSRILKAYFA